MLSDGPVLAVQLQQDAEKNGISGATLRRAKDALGIGSRKIGSSWAWELPNEGAQVSEVLDLDLG